MVTAGGRAGGRSEGAPVRPRPRPAEHAEPSRGRPVNLTSEDVQDILRLLDTLPYGEFVLETSRFTLRLRRAEGGVWAQELTVLTDPVPTEPPVTPLPAPGPAGPPGTAPPSTAPPSTAPPSTGPPSTGPPSAGHPGTGQPGTGALHEVRAALSGTFYRAPNPGAPPFVEVGDEVTADSVVA